MSVKIEIAWDDYSEQKSNRDLILKVGDKAFWISRKELADSSPVFKTMLYGQFQEATKDEIQLPGKDAEEVLELLRCLFPTISEVSCSSDSKDEDETKFKLIPTTKEVDEKNLEILLKFADEYEIDYLTEKCSMFLTKLVKKKRGVDKEKEIMEYFLIGIRYKLKKFVRSVLRVFLRCDMAKVLEYGCELPVEVRYAILLPFGYQKFNHVFEEYRDEMSDDCGLCHKCRSGLPPPPKLHDIWQPHLKCKFGSCHYNVCGKCMYDFGKRGRKEYLRTGGDTRCKVGHCGTCSDEFGKTEIFCKCIDSLAITELEKVGL